MAVLWREGLSRDPVSSSHDDNQRQAPSLGRARTPLRQAVDEVQGGAVAVPELP
jgi:hypothetical protein